MSMLQLTAPCAAWLPLVCSVGPWGYHVDHRGRPAALSRAGISLPLLEQPEGDGVVALSADGRASLAAAAAAGVASDVALRAALLEGFCLFTSGAVSEAAGPNPGQGGQQQLAEVPHALAAEVVARAEAAAQSALALQQALQAAAQQQQQQEEAGEGGVQPAPAAAGDSALVAVPDAWLAGAEGEGRGGELSQIMPPTLMHYPSCRAMQLGLLALQVGGGSRLLCICQLAPAVIAQAVALFPTCYAHSSFLLQPPCFCPPRRI